MKVPNLFGIATVIVTTLVLATSSQPALGQVAGQAKPAPTVIAGKVAVINTEVFADVKVGITRLVNALSTVEREFKPKRDELQTLRTRYEQLQKEIDATKNLADQKSLAAKTDQAEVLKRDMERKQQDGQDALTRRAKELTDPIYEDVGKALLAYATQRGIDLVFDVSKLGGVLFITNEKTDITVAFIADYNSRNPAGAVKTP